MKVDYNLCSTSGCIFAVFVHAYLFIWFLSIALLTCLALNYSMYDVVIVMYVHVKQLTYTRSKFRKYIPTIARFILLHKSTWVFQKYTNTRAFIHIKVINAQSTHKALVGRVCAKL